MCVTQSGTTAAQRSVAGHARDDRRRCRGGGHPLARRHRDRRRWRRCTSEIAWAELRPLHGRRIVVTRARAQASGLVARLRDLGAEVDECAVIRIEPLPGPPIDAALYGLVCVTSPNAPRLLLERCGGDARALAGATVAAIGPGTAAALRETGIVADVVAERSLAEGLLEALPPDLHGVRALVARAEEARDTLPDGSARRGRRGRRRAALPHARRAAAPARAHALGRRGRVHVVIHRPALRRGAPGARSLGVRGVSIGPVTSATARELGVGVVAEAARHDLDGLTETLLEVLSEPREA